ncbi:holo-[acyl-carrier-protein] synthase [bacterium]|nr:MAG: holo-[acyl-carrier-protein] synthase [bacterium]
MITGVGTDIVEIDRFRNLEQKAEFLEQVFTHTEIHSAPNGSSQDTFYATLFAVKEAILKALGCGLQQGSVWRDIQISHDWSPHLSGFLGRLAEEKSVSKIHVSHAHAGKSAVAFVLIETTNEEKIL